MNKKNKLQKFNDILHYPNVMENYERLKRTVGWNEDLELEINGKWRDTYFKNSHPVILELACGKGDYTLGLARMKPDQNFIGVDIKGNRIWKGATVALEEKLENVAFLRTRIENIDFFFDDGEVDEIWITFPDPFPRKSKAGKRLTSPRFLELYRKILRKGGIVHLKTDSESLFDYTEEVWTEDPKCQNIELNRDIYSSIIEIPELHIQTFYEKQHIADGRKINYISTTIHG